MKARFAHDVGAGIQVVVIAETDDERLLMVCFVQQVQRLGFHLHGYGGASSNPGLDNFNFGSLPPKKEEP